MTKSLSKARTGKARHSVPSVIVLVGWSVNQFAKIIERKYAFPVCLLMSVTFPLL